MNAAKHSSNKGIWLFIIVKHLSFLQTISKLKMWTLARRYFQSNDINHDSEHLRSGLALEHNHLKTLVENYPIKFFLFNPYGFWQYNSIKVVPKSLVFMFSNGVQSFEQFSHIWMNKVWTRVLSQHTYPMNFLDSRTLIGNKMAL